MRVSFVLRSAEASSLGLCNTPSNNYRDIPFYTICQLASFFAPNYRDIPRRLGKKPSTPWCSRAVPQPSTDPALHRLAAEFGWDPAYSMQYGRRLLRSTKK